MLPGNIIILNNISYIIKLYYNTNLLIAIISITIGIPKLQPIWDVKTKVKKIKRPTTDRVVLKKKNIYKRNIGMIALRKGRLSNRSLLLLHIKL